MTGIVKYMIDQSKPAAVELKNLKETKNFMAFDDVTIIGFFEQPEGQLYDSFVEAAEKTRNDFKIGYTINPDVFKNYKVKKNLIVIFYPEIFWSKYEPRTKSYKTVINFYYF